MKNAEYDNITESLKQIGNADRILPSQPALRQQFIGDDEQFYQQLDEAMLSILPEKSIDEKWDINLKPGVTYASFGSNISTLYFYQFLISISKAKDILELGTFIGVSAMFLAEAVGKSGNITTVEIGEEFAKIANNNFKTNGCDNINLINGCVVDVLNKFKSNNKKFDMILIDAAKEKYSELFDISLDILNEGGILLVDDIFFQGDTLNKQNTSVKGKGVKELLQKVSKLDRSYQRVILPFGNGLLMVRNQSDLKDF